jgi:sulfur transfer complex TusBCD TusB component (DsrH family)
MALHVLHEPNRLRQLAAAIDEHDAVLLVDGALQRYLVSGPEAIANLPCPAYALATELASHEPEPRGITELSFADWVDLTSQHAQFVTWK